QRYGHRQDDGANGARLPGVRPGRRANQPRIRRHRSRPGDQPAVVPTDGWGRDDGKRVRQGVVVHRAAARARRRASARIVTMSRILLVEDNEMNRDMLSRRLARRGFDVLFALDGAAAVDMARRELPDVILMDMSLPVIDGWEA